VSNAPKSIPRPLVRTNQWFIVIFVLASWISGIYWLLLFPLIAGLLGVLLNYNPVVQFAKLFLKKHPSQYIPEDAEQQRFNQTIASILLLLGFLCFLFHWTVLAYVFTIMVALAAFIAILGFCIGCFIHYHWHQYRYRKSQKV
jgi:divalent metal cation (Fe/Co/Zn/Cd) transporter